VEIKGKGIVNMMELQIGDFVMSGSGKFTQVYGFGHFDHDREENFLQIQVGHNPLQISPIHLVFVERNNQSYPIRALDVMVGDMLSGQQVQSIRTIRQRGIYAPLTQSGDIVVSGIVSSNYVAILQIDQWTSMQHMLGHTLLYPQRCFCYYFIERCKKERYIQGYG
jgi:Hint module